MIVVRSDLPKLCHARPGDVVQLVDQAGEVQPPVYVVAVVDTTGARPMRAHMSHGLYDEVRPLFLVDVETGVTREMPHLSSRAKIHHGAEMHFVQEVPHGR